MKNKFVFYTSWNDVLQKLDEAHFRRAVNNLCLDCEDKPPVLTDAIDEMFWSFVKPIMNFNETKRQRRIENGKKGGEAKASNSYQNVANDSNSYQNVANPSDKSKEIIDKSKEIIDKSKEIIDKGKEIIDKGKGLKDKLIKVNRQLLDEGIIENIDDLTVDLITEMLNVHIDIIWEEKLNKNGVQSTIMYLNDNNVEVDYIISSLLNSYEILKNK